MIEAGMSNIIAHPTAYKVIFTAMFLLYGAMFLHMILKRP
jgi:hypothetical protein